MTLLRIIMENMGQNKMLSLFYHSKQTASKISVTLKY